MTYLPELKRAETIAPFWASVQPIAKRVDRQLLYYISGDAPIDPDEGLLALRLYAELFLALFEHRELIVLRDELDFEAIEADVDDGQAAAHDFAVLAALIARACARDGEYESATSWLSKAAETLTSVPPGAELDLAQSHCLLALAELQLEVQDFSGAATQVREALRHCGEAPSRSDRLRFDLAIVEGTLRFIAGDWSDALRAYGHATTLAHRHGSPVEALLGHLPAAATLYLSGHGSLVEQQLAHALAVAESLPGAPTLRLFVTELPLNFVGRAGIAGMIERGRRLLDDAESARNHRFLPLTVAWIAALCGGSGEREKARLVVETTHQTIAAKGQLTPAMRELAGRIARDWPR